MVQPQSIGLISFRRYPNWLNRLTAHTYAVEWIYRRIHFLHFEEFFVLFNLLNQSILQTAYFKNAQIIQSSMRRNEWKRILLNFQLSSNTLDPKEAVTLPFNNEWIDFFEITWIERWTCLHTLKCSECRFMWIWGTKKSR